MSSDTSDDVHDEHCEAEFIHRGWTECDCAVRSAIRKLPIPDGFVKGFVKGFADWRIEQ